MFDETSGTWTVDRRRRHRPLARVLVAATGVLSLPFFPDVPGRESFGGESYHTGLWPSTPVDFVGKRVAVIGTGSSGVQLIAAIADEVESLTVYQRTANWCTPLNNRPITPEEQAQLRADFESIRHTLNTSASGFLHVPCDRSAFDDSPEQRRAFYEKMWNSPGFSKMTSNYRDLLTDQEVNAEWCEFLADKIRGIVDGSRDRRQADPRPSLRPAAPAVRHQLLRDVQQAERVAGRPEGDADPRRSPSRASRRPTALQEFDIIVWATGFDFGTGALNRMGIRGRDGLALEEYWADGPSTYLGVVCRGFPNFFFPGGPHGVDRQQPALRAATRSTSSPTRSCTCASTATTSSR